jgi:hypothetical protein
VPQFLQHLPDFCDLLGVHRAFARLGAMCATKFTVRIDSAVKERLERLSTSTGCSRSFLAAEAISGYLDVNEWRVAGIGAHPISALLARTIDLVVRKFGAGDVNRTHGIQLGKVVGASFFF